MDGVGVVDNGLRRDNGFVGIGTVKTVDMNIDIVRRLDCEDASACGVQGTGFR